MRQLYQLHRFVLGCPGGALFFSYDRCLTSRNSVVNQVSMGLPAAMPSIIHRLGAGDDWYRFSSVTGCPPPGEFPGIASFSLPDAGPRTHSVPSDVTIS